MKQNYTRTKRGAKGSVNALMAVCLIPLSLVFACAFDGFLVMASHLQQDNNAEYAALAGLKVFRDLDSMTLAFRENQAIARAEAVAGKNFYLGAPGKMQARPTEIASNKAGKIFFGNYDTSSASFTEGPDGAGKFNALKIELFTQDDNAVQVFFAGTMGVQKVGLKSTVIAYYSQQLADQGQPGYVLVHKQ